MTYGRRHTGGTSVPHSAPLCDWRIKRNLLPLSKESSIVHSPINTAIMMEEQEGESDNDNHGVTSINSPDEMLTKGLRLAGYKRRRRNRVKKETNIERFKAIFGSSPAVVAAIWEDLQLTEIPEAHVHENDRNIKYFLIALHHLKRYPTEYEREAMFDVSLMWGRDWCWFFVEKIQALKTQKIGWPEDNFGGDIFAITVDGTHCWLQEPQHATWSQDSRYFSHKYGKAGLAYELGISISESKLVWLNGPFMAGKNDVQIFQKGLKQKLQTAGKMAIGDGGYTGHPYQCSTPNNHNSSSLSKFKSRALKRHERFNGLTKAFNCLSGRFRHSVDRFTNCFEAVCVICQYQVEMDCPLFEVLIEELMDN
jgi:hypothetical protein